MVGQHLVKLIVAHRFGLGRIAVRFVPAVDVRNDFPKGEVFNLANASLKPGREFNYFGSSEASVVVVKPVSGASAGSAFPSSSTFLPTGSSGTPIITA